MRSWLKGKPEFEIGNKQGRSHRGRCVRHTPYHVPHSQLCGCLCPREPILAPSVQSAA